MKKLPYTLFGVGNSCVHFENLETLSLWRKMSYFYGSQKFEIFIDSKGIELSQRRWVNLLKDYDCIVDYHLGKANVMANALSRKSLPALKAMNAHLKLEKMEP